jgi:hypothetical protein
LVVGYLEPSFVILSAGVGCEANGAESKDPGTANPEEDIRELSPFNTLSSLVRMPFDFIVTQSSMGSFDFADSPLHRQSASLRMT